MEKRKYELSKYADMHTEKEIIGSDGVHVTVVNHISYVDKEQMANAIAQVTLSLYNESCAYENAGYDKTLKYMVAQFYTDIDVEDESPDNVADFLINNDLWNEIRDFISDDITVVLTMYNMIMDSAILVYNDDKSLKTAIRTSFGFLFNGEDLTETLAKAEAAKDTVYNAVGAVRELEKEKQGKLKKGKMDIGGKVINFAKKEDT